MPQIFKQEIEINIPKIIEKRILLRSLKNQMYGCTCQHLNGGHYLCYGKCYYPNCDCKEFKSMELNIEVTITNADIYEFENPDHEIRDSFAWWNEFELWRQKNEKQPSI